MICLLFIKVYSKEGAIVIELQRGNTTCTILLGLAYVSKGDVVTSACLPLVAYSIVVSTLLFCEGKRVVVD